MKIFSQTLLLLSMLIAIHANAQTTKKTTPTKTATPVKKTPVKKATVQQNSGAKAATIAKAKEDSVAAVNALAMQMARQMVREDSIRKARAVEQTATDEKLKQEQLAAEEKKATSEKSTKSKPKTEKVAKTKSQKKEKEPVKKVPDELRPMAKPSVASEEANSFIGLKASGIAAFVVGKDIPEFAKPYYGYGGGLVANFGLGKHLSFQPEVLYAQEGFSVKGEEDGEKVNASFVLSGIQVPLLIKYSFGEYNKGFFINAGPYGTYLLNSKVTDKTPGGTNYTYKPEKTTIEYGVAAGLGVAVPMGRGRLLVEARGTYYLGASGDELDLDKASLVTAALSIGYLFPIGH